MKRTCALMLASVGVSLVGIQLVTAQAPPAPKPGPEPQRLAYFVGKWTVAGEMKASPMGPGGKITSTDTCDWFDGRLAVVCHSVGMTPMRASRSPGILSYSPEQKDDTYYGRD